MRKPSFTIAWALLVLSGFMVSSCTLIRPLEKVESTTSFDYDGMILGGRPDRGLSLALARDSKDPYTVEVILKNEGERRLCVYSAFVLDLGQYDASPNLAFVVERVVNGETLRPSRTSWTSGGRDTRRSMFKILRPKEYYAMSVDISDYYELEPGVEYRVTAEYVNEQTGYERNGWNEMYAWVGKLKSNRLLVK
jgi:hypothetical protein